MLTFQHPESGTVGTNYLVRVADICSEIAITLMAATPRAKKANGQFRVALRGDENTQDYKENNASLYQSNASRDHGQKNSRGQNARGLEAEGVANGFEFAIFARDLDVLRRRMIGVSFCEQVRMMSRQIAGVMECGDELGLEQMSDNEQIPKSICDAITSAVLLLPCHDTDARRAR